MRPNLVSTLIGAVFVLSAATVAGCGGGDGLDRVAVSGSVTINGEPVPNGVVRFKPAQGTEGPMANTMITDGRYDVPGDQGPVAGNYDVQVLAYEDPNAAAEPTASVRPAVASDKLGPKTSSDDPDNEATPVVPQAPKEAKRTFNITIPELSSFEQDFAL